MIDLVCLKWWGVVRESKGSTYCSFRFDSKEERLVLMKYTLRWERSSHSRKKGGRGEGRGGEAKTYHSRDPLPYRRGWENQIVSWDMMKEVELREVELRREGSVSENGWDGKERRDKNGRRGIKEIWEIKLVTKGISPPFVRPPPVSTLKKYLPSIHPLTRPQLL